MWSDAEQERGEGDEEAAVGVCEEAAIATDGEFETADTGVELFASAAAAGARGPGGWVRELGEAGVEGVVELRRG